MDNKSNNRQNRSMFLYTALIFAVALLLIILAFFGQTNLTNLRRTADEAAATEIAMALPTPTPALTETAPPDPDALAKLSNTVSTLDAENKELKAINDTYDVLSSAVKYVSEGNKAEAQKAIDTVEASKLTDAQKALYDYIINIIKQ